MNILHAAAECLPFASTGGLGDVVGALPGAQRELGAQASIILPRYGFAEPRLQHGQPICGIDLEDRQCRILLSAVRANGAPVYLVDLPGLFDRDGDPYHDVNGRQHPDNALRFGRFCEAVARFACMQPSGPSEVVHLHDWHTGLVPAWLRQLQWRGRCVFSIHNLAYQGACSAEEARATGLDASYRPVATDGHGSFMRSALNWADEVVTVSRTYSEAIQTREQGCGLHDLLRQRAGRRQLHGIVNGIDDRLWNPESDPLLSCRYGVDDVNAGKRINRTALARSLGLAHADKPMVVFIGRLADQKGADLIVEAGDHLLKLDASYVFMGVGDARMSRGLRTLARRSDGRAVFLETYDIALSRRLMAAADILLMPSRFEPCGMTQLYAQRYGAIPVAHRTGGLVDTVVDMGTAANEREDATGILFDGADVSGLLEGLRRGLILAGDPVWLSKLRRNGMSRPLGWSRAAADYLDLYRGETGGQKRPSLHVHTETLNMNKPKRPQQQKQSSARKPGQGHSQQEDRGPGARKVELEKRLDANAEIEAKATEGRRRAKTREEEEEAIDEALKESFPASDSPAPAVPKRGDRRMG